MRNKQLASLALEMRKHKQNETESLLDHGIAVAQSLWRIRAALETGLPGPDFVPEVIMQHRDYLLSETQVYSNDWREIRRAIVFHDCGKPVDWKDHAVHSARMYKELGGTDLGTSLIADDMKIHMLKADQCDEFKRNQHWILLYLIGLAAINANSVSWGKDSTNFKIKKKHFEQRAKRLLNTKSTQTETV